MTNDIRIRDNRQQVYDLLWPYTYIGTQYYTGNSFEFPYPTGPSLPDYHIMVDVVNRDFSNTWRSGIFPVSPCLHYTVALSRIGIMDDWTMIDGSVIRYDKVGRGRLSLINDTGYPDQWKVIIDSLIDPLGFISSTAHGAFVVPESLRADLSEQAFNYFSDVFPQKLSFTEFVQGFTQLKELLPSIQESVTKTVSGGYLAKKFGWDNLLSDLNTLANGYNSVLSRMQYLHRTYGVPTRLGFNRNDIYHPNLDNSVHYGQSVIAGSRIKLTKYVANFRATAWIYQVLEYIHDFIGFLRVTAGALGLNNPVKAFWNVVPLSFVVDWFFNVSQHLDHLTRLNPAEGWNVTNVTNSITYELEWEVDHWYPGYAPMNIPSRILKVFTVPATGYDRAVGLSFPWELLNPEELSPSQLSLLLAMLHQLG